MQWPKIYDNPIGKEIVARIAKLQAIKNFVTKVHTIVARPFEDM